MGLPYLQFLGVPEAGAESRKTPAGGEHEEPWCDCCFLLGLVQMLLGGQRAGGGEEVERTGTELEAGAGGWRARLQQLYLQGKRKGMAGKWAHTGGGNRSPPQDVHTHSEDTKKERMLGMALRPGKDPQGRPRLCLLFLRSPAPPHTESSPQQRTDDWFLRVLWPRPQVGLFNTGLPVIAFSGCETCCGKTRSTLRTRRLRLCSPLDLWGKDTFQGQAEG